MSTDYRLTLRASDGTTGRITIIDSLNPLPGSDTWSADQPSQWDADGGAVSSWASGGTYLSGPVGVQSIFLDGFGKNTSVSDRGCGTKNYTDGSFPTGSFEWQCIEKD